MSIREHLEERVEECLKQLQSSNELIRKQAAVSLGFLGRDSSRAVEALEVQLQQDSSLGVQKALIESLSKIGSSRAINALMRSFRSEKNPTLLEKIAVALNVTENLEILGELLSILQTHEHKITRYWAAWLLKQKSDVELVPGLVRCLLDTDKDIRNLVVETLQRIGIETVRGKVLEFIKKPKELTDKLELLNILSIQSSLEVFNNELDEYKREYEIKFEKKFGSWVKSSTMLEILRRIHILIIQILEAQSDNMVRTDTLSNLIGLKEPALHRTLSDLEHMRVIKKIGDYWKLEVVEKEETESLINRILERSSLIDIQTATNNIGLDTPLLSFKDWDVFRHWLYGLSAEKLNNLYDSLLKVREARIDRQKRTKEILQNFSLEHVLAIAHDLEIELEFESIPHQERIQEWIYDLREKDFDHLYEALLEEEARNREKRIAEIKQSKFTLANLSTAFTELGFSCVPFQFVRWVTAEAWLRYLSIEDFNILYEKHFRSLKESKIDTLYDYFLSHIQKVAINLRLEVVTHTFADWDATEVWMHNLCYEDLCKLESELSDNFRETCRELRIELLVKTFSASNLRNIILNVFNDELQTMDVPLNNFENWNSIQEWLQILDEEMFDLLCKKIIKDQDEVIVRENSIYEIYAQVWKDDVKQMSKRLQLEGSAENFRDWDSIRTWMRALPSEDFNILYEELTSG